MALAAGPSLAVPVEEPAPLTLPPSAQEASPSAATQLPEPAELPLPAVAVPLLPPWAPVAFPVPPQAAFPPTATQLPEAAGVSLSTDAFVGWTSVEGGVTAAVTPSLPPIATVPVGVMFVAATVAGTFALASVDVVAFVAPPVTAAFRFAAGVVVSGPTSALTAGATPIPGAPALTWTIAAGVCGPGSAEAIDVLMERPPATRTPRTASSIPIRLSIFTMHLL
jgi:hypothetical protein